MAPLIARRRPRPWLLAPLLAALALAACEEAEEPARQTVRPVRAVQLGDTSTFVQRWFLGRARATQEVDLSFRVSGPLSEFPVEVGDSVEEGQLIARIDPTTFVAEVTRARAELERAIAEATNADAQFSRQATLTERGWSAQARLDEVTAAADATKAIVAAQRAALDRAELDLGYTALRAPFAGRIVRTYVENFQNVVEKQPVARLLDMTQIEMVVDVPESLIPYAGTVESVDVIFDPFPDRVISARIKEIGLEASETTRTFPVTLIMDQPEGLVILPGMAGRASPADAPPPDLGGEGMVVPDTAVFVPPDADTPSVWVLDPAAGVVHRRAVRTGAMTRYGPAIVEGVEPGEWVVTVGVHNLEEGQSVRLLSETDDSTGEVR